MHEWACQFESRGGRKSMAGVQEQPDGDDETGGERAASAGAGPVAAAATATARIKGRSCGAPEESAGKENVQSDKSDNRSSKTPEFSTCHECKRSLANSRELINVTGQARRRWHPECFKCAICREPMDERRSCHVFEGRIVCRDDYARLRREQAPADAGVKCARCRWPIGLSDWVRKAAGHVYHLACFNCDICSRQLNTGEQFILSSEEDSGGGGGGGDARELVETAPVRLLCRLHFTIDHGGGKRPTTACDGADESEGEKSAREPDQRDEPDAPKSARQAYEPSCLGSHAASSSAGEGVSIMAQPEPGGRLAPIGADAGAEGSSFLQQLQGQLMRSPAGSPSGTSSSNNTSLLGCGESAGGPGTPPSASQGAGGLLGSGSKSKRVRTTFTEDQLSILQTHFQIDSNPDGQDLERIATITGLSKRVTQVWFQNSRARQKKYLIKRKPMHASGHLAAPGGGHHHHAHHAHLAHHAHHAHPLAGGISDEDISRSPSASHNQQQQQHLGTFEELAHYHRGSHLFAAGLEQLQRRSEPATRQDDGLAAAAAGAPANGASAWADGRDPAREERLHDQEPTGGQDDGGRASVLSAASSSGELDAGRPSSRPGSQATRRFGDAKSTDEFK